MHDGESGFNDVVSRPLISPEEIRDLQRNLVSIFSASLEGFSSSMNQAVNESSTRH